MRLPGKVLPALAALLLSASAAHPASGGRTHDGAHVATAGLNLAARNLDVDIELVLAVDVSDSMNMVELAQQRNGYVEAFRHPEIFDAITRGEFGRIAVTYVEWAGPYDQSVMLPWAILADPEDAAGFAAKLAALRLKPEIRTAPPMTGTSISDALLFAAGLFQGNGVNSLSQTIDISGDGPNNAGAPILAAREAVIRQGITINGLPLVLGKRTLPIDAYYEQCVIGGPGAFSITVSDPAEFVIAIRRKLVLEIAELRPMAIAASFQPLGPQPSPEFCERWHRDSPDVAQPAPSFPSQDYFWAH